MTTTTMPLYFVDTLKLSKRLEKAGLQQKVAEELSEAIKDTHTQSLEGLATKQALKNLEIKLEKKIDNLEKKIDIFEQKIDTLEHKMTSKIFAMLVVAIGVITWLDKIF